MTDLYVPYCQNKTNSEELLASHRTYLSVSDPLRVSLYSNLYSVCPVYLVLIYHCHHSLLNQYSV